MFDTIKNHYINIRAAKARAAEATAAAAVEVADSERHIAALTAGLFDEEKTKLASWLAENKIVAVVAEAVAEMEPK